MPQDYKLISFEKGDFTDPHGNYWCTAALEGIGEPVKWVVKDPTKVREGQTYYGEVKEMTSKAGKSYLRFYKKQRPDGAPTNSSNDSPRGSNSGGEWQDRSDGMKQGMCVNNATLFVNLMFEMSGEKPSPEDWAEAVFTHAQALYKKGDLGKVAPEQAPIIDTVVTDIGNGDINLDEIPF